MSTMQALLMLVLLIGLAATLFVVAARWANRDDDAFTYDDPDDEEDECPR